MAITRTGPNGAIRLTLELEGAEDVDVSLSRFGREIQDWRPFWRERLGPKFFAAVQRNFERRGRLAQPGGWPPLSPSYRAWKQAHYPGRKILERTLALRRSMTWRGSLFSPGGGRGNLGPGGVFRPTPTDVTLGTAVPYGAYHQQGAAARSSRGRQRSRATGRFMRGGGRARSVVSGRFLRGLPPRKFLFFVRGTTYARLLQSWLVELRGRVNLFGSGGVAGSGAAFSREA